MLAKQALRRPVALGAARACSSSATTSGRPGARAAEMEKAADKVQSGKNAWQKTVGGIVDAIRPITSALAPTIMPILDAPYQRGVRNAVNIDDLQAVAERRAHAMVYGYLAGGADAERSLRRSVAAFNDVELRHAVLHGVGHNDMDMRTTILGHEAQLPFFVTSCAGQRMFHADGEVATAKAAKKHGCFMALSQLTTSTFEDVREAHPDGAKCLQLYVWRDRVLLKEVRAAQFCAILARNAGIPLPTSRPPAHPRLPHPSLQVLDRAKAVGFTSLALTADFSWVGNRERETKTGFTVPPSYSVRQCIDAIKSPAWTYDYMSRVPYGYKAVPDADFPAESLVDFIAAQVRVRVRVRVRLRVRLRVRVRLGGKAWGWGLG